LRNDLLKGIDGEISRMEGLLDELSGLREMTTGSARCASSRSRWPSGCRSCLPPGGRPPRTLGWQDDIPTDLPIVRIDPARLGQAFGNLLSNAVKYTSAGGKVRVSVGLEGAGWHLQVADSGPGISDAERERIFELFYRTPPERRSPQGLGLGLPIALDLVRAHGGEVILDSCPGAGRMLYRDAAARISFCIGSA
jgi:signal transduction histidine kinase